MVEQKLEDGEVIEETVVIDSKMIDSHPANMYISSDRLFFGPHEVNRSEIEDIQLIKDERNDYKSVGLILTHTTLGMILAYTISLQILLSMLIVGLTTLVGYGVVRLLRHNPFGYVELETEEAEYRFGLSGPIDAARLFSEVYQDIDKEFTHEAFKISGEKDSTEGDKQEIATKSVESE